MKSDEGVVPNVVPSGVAVVFGDETALSPPNEHLRTRTEGRLRAGTSGYGEVRLTTVRLGVRVPATGNNTRITAAICNCIGFLILFRRGRFTE